jgi:plasmid stability protein
MPQHLHERLREHADADGRSMSAEAVAILERALLDVDRAARRGAATERLRDIQRRNVLPAAAPAAEQLVRQDRDR